MKELGGKTAFITGGASGIGLGMATVLGRAGMRIALADVEAAALEEAAGRLTAEGTSVLPLEVDVADRHAMEEAAHATERAYGKVHLVCNNAGVGAGGPLDQCTYDDWDWVLGVNLGGVINGVQTFVRRIKAHGEGGHFVNTASIAGLLAGGGLGIYTTTKFAVVGLSETLRIDLAPHGIGVSVLCPGFVSTRIWDARRNRPPRYPDTEYQPDPELRAAHRARIVGGLDPLRVGEAVRDTVVADRLFIFTHPELKDLVAERTRAILGDFEATDRDRLVKLARAFLEAFNRNDLDAVMAFFAEDAVYDEYDGKRNLGKPAIRRAFEPQFRGDFGKMRFDEEDLFVDSASNQVMASWRCWFERKSRPTSWRGLDLLHFRGAELVYKGTYANAERLQLED